MTKDQPSLITTLLLASGVIMVLAAVGVHLLLDGRGALFLERALLFSGGAEILIALIIRRREKG